MSDLTDKTTLYCSFCAKSQHEVKKLIAGPKSMICDECVELCNNIIDEDKKTYAEKAAENELIEQGRTWLIADYKKEQQSNCDEQCRKFENRVKGGLLDKDPRLLGFIHGLKESNPDRTITLSR